MTKKKTEALNNFRKWLLENVGTLPDDFELDPSDKPEHLQSIPNLADVATRKRLTSAALQGFLKLVEIWRLTDSEARAISGISAQRTWLRIKKGGWQGAFSQDQLTRLSAILGIYSGLHILYSDRLADEWARRPNSGPLFRGRPPLDVIISGGIPALIEVRRHVNASIINSF